MPWRRLDRLHLRRSVVRAALSAVLTTGRCRGGLASGLLLLGLVGCAERRESERQPQASWLAPGAQVVALGNLTTGRPPTPSQLRLAVFLFGTEPEPGLALIKPMDLAVAGEDLLVCDGALQSVLRWRARDAVLESLFTPELPHDPRTIAVLPGGDWLVGDASGVTRLAATGQSQVRYTLSSTAGPARPGGVLALDDEIWVSNVNAHQIEVFDSASGRPRRVIGRRGRGAGEFGLPLGLAVFPAGSGNPHEIFVVDMLNARVQVLARDGRWLRDIGGPGDRTGYFGRPRAVAVGPDGTVFVTDAASQSVQAFTRDGRPLLRFGGAEDGADALVLPAGIAVWRGPLRAAKEVPAGFSPDYYVLVAEQIRRPGLRVYGWRIPSADQLAPPRRPMRPVGLAERVDSPHGRVDGCTVCHEAAGGRITPIAITETDRLCLSCHDGLKASREPHPIGRLAAAPGTVVPAGWPLVEGRIGCLTCHDIRRQCDEPNFRPADNPALVRGFDVRNPLASCLSCHRAENWRTNPHRSEVAGFSEGAVGCAFCHVSVPRRVMAGDSGEPGSWEFDARLRAPATELCLNCHTMHADPAPQGHLGLEVSREMKSRMIAAESGGHSVEPLTAGREPEWLRLEGGRIGCATCHNPHPPEGFPRGLAAPAYAQRRSSAPADAGFALRMDQLDLCSHCHGK